MDRAPAIRQTAKPAAPYSTKPPSPPHVFIEKGTQWLTPMKIVPLYDNIDPASLTNKELSIITQNGLEQVACDTSMTWTYENRRQAQRVLDFLYLGPSVVLRNRQWLQEQGITMVLAARDIKQAGLNIMTVDKVAQELGIEARYLDVSGYDALVASFPSAVRAINEHMLRIYREQAVAMAATEMRDGAMAIDESKFRRGKVLVFCETGNDRSASVVAAYLMAVIGMTALQACHFVTHSRFCVSMDEGIKHALQVYEDILLAQRMVHRHELEFNAASMAKKAKRGVDDIIGDDGDAEMAGIDRSELIDQGRFLGRSAFVPFVDS